MAHSYLRVGDGIERIHDIDLLILVHLLVRHAEASGSEQPELIESLRKTANTRGLGVIDLKLNWIVADLSRKAYFLGLLDAVDQELDQMGETYPVALLKKGWLTRGVSFSNDYKTALIRSAVSKARNLVKQS